MCAHEGQPCPGRSCRCECMTCLMGEETEPPVTIDPVRYTYPAVNERHRTTHAEVRKTGETLGAYDFEHREGWTSDGANFTGTGSNANWQAHVGKLATRKGGATDD